MELKDDNLTGSIFEPGHTKSTPNEQNQNSRCKFGHLNDDNSPGGLFWPSPRCCKSTQIDENQQKSRAPGRQTMEELVLCSYVSFCVGNIFVDICYLVNIFEQKNGFCLYLLPCTYIRAEKYREG